MAHYNVLMNNGNWRVFSTAVDDYITEEMDFDHLKEHRRTMAIAKAAREADFESDSLLQMFPMVNRMTQKEAERKIALRESFENSDNQKSNDDDQENTMSRSSVLARYIGPDRPNLWHNETYMISVGMKTFDFAPDLIEVHISFGANPVYYSSKRQFSKEWIIINDQN